MSNLKNTHELIRQNEKNVKKSQKHDVNLQKNSTFYFQIGLIVCLLVTVGLLEMNFEKTIPNYQKEFPPLEDPEFVYIPLFKDAVPVVDELAKKTSS